MDLLKAIGIGNKLFSNADDIEAALGAKAIDVKNKLGVELKTGEKTSTELQYVTRWKVQQDTRHRTCDFATFVHVIRGARPGDAFAET